MSQALFRRMRARPRQRAGEFPVDFLGGMPYFRAMFCQRKRTAWWLPVALFVFLPPPAFPQESPQQLEELRRNIVQLQQKISSLEKSESSELDRLRALEEQIDLMNRLVGRLRRQEISTRQEAGATLAGLRETEAELQRLQTLGARRAVFFYKYGRLKDLEMLLSSRSLNQVLLWAEYQRRLFANDRRLLAGMRSKQARIQAQNEKLAGELAAYEKMLAEKLQEEQALRQRKQEREALLNKLRQDKSFHQMQLTEQQQAAARIARLIAAAEAALQQQQEQTAPPAPASGEGRLTTMPLPTHLPAEPFAGRRGRLPWPVDGQIVGHYGSYRHPVLKTITTNLGIDIAAASGTSVRSVAAGKVTTITWQRGYGNLLIINHADGYYTVYTRLAEIFVNLNETVAAGQLIGTVAEAPPGQQATLHFQIWQRTKEARSQDLNPEEWLQ
ncbi:MAG: peptidoglycan DD-metalloendopeptidase family protein [candidate division KSB1 bacterium]|nr:peptidoglycan DD-metalloendopeptidase family protein [candidate division KSB1 bacterium]MDZ7273175.1 peptidoglycan DD-metalloendopeptidase family protein [candidate division KSB1 bacterium]MDZ7285277.1 peptidoglycan DD-metalloendopeptidase family protein [candidate division KSB1 bacterium]MDZ7298309.1 peptidoglycan DD-metalloendopeptidase family protein [candidate division KSB1 bacterium]MDZ7307384.1 peptidoglycan DD-metalloendopeptidase family protein [candidate division KSB1 bacterium]